MTFTIEPHYVYLGATTILAILQILNYIKLQKVKSDVESIWQQLAVMAIASSGAFDKLDKKIDGKEDRK